MILIMIKNFLILSCIGKDDKLGMRINKEFFIHKFENIDKQKNKEYLVSEILKFLKSHNIEIDKNFSVIVNLGPGSFSSIRITLAVAKGLQISKKIKLYGFKNENLTTFDQKNVEKLLTENLIEKKLIKPIYLS